MLLLLEDELRVAVVLFWGEVLRVAVVLLLLEEVLRLALVLRCCELLDEDLTAELFDEEELLREADVLLDDDELRDAVVDLELPPERVCAVAGTWNASAPARRAASVSLNSFIILWFLLSPGEVDRPADIG
mgnify:CR=1 FL=1